MRYVVAPATPDQVSLAERDPLTDTAVSFDASECATSGPVSISATTLKKCVPADSEPPVPASEPLTDEGALTIGLRHASGLVMVLRRTSMPVGTRLGMLGSTPPNRMFSPVASR